MVPCPHKVASYNTNYIKCVIKSYYVYINIFKLNDVGFLEAYSTLKGIDLLIDLGLTPLNIELESINAGFVFERLKSEFKKLETNFGV